MLPLSHVSVVLHTIGHLSTLLHQWFLEEKLNSSLRMLYGRFHELVDRYGIYVSHITTDMFQLS